MFTNKSNIKILLVLIITTPLFVWFVFNFKQYFSEWKNTPRYAKNISQALYPKDNLSKIEESRWNAFGPAREELISRVFYNKGYLLVDNFFSYLSYFSPRIFFHSGDATGLSPCCAEPIPVVYFPAFVLGIISLFKYKRIKIAVTILAFGFLAFILGKKNLAYLMPVAISYFLISVYGIMSLSKKWQKVYVVLIIIYSLILLGRLIWVR